jgi:hypothetical protein
MKRPEVRLWLDDLRSPPEGWVAVDSVNEAVKVLLSCDVVEAALDHDLSFSTTDESPSAVRQNGMHLLVWMKETGNWPRRRPAVHTSDECKGREMREFITAHFRARKG